MKLIKLNEQHYIVVDDSEIKEGDYYLCWETINDIPSNYEISDKPLHSYCIGADNYKKITHSTQPLEAPVAINGFDTYDFISLSEVEEAINGYSVEKMAKLHRVNISDDWSEASYIKGFNAHKDLVKDNFILSEDDLHRILDMARLQGEESFLVKHTNEEIIQSLLPKTEWEVEFDEQGKLKLI